MPPVTRSWKDKEAFDNEAEATQFATDLAMEKLS